MRASTWSRYAVALLAVAFIAAACTSGNGGAEDTPTESESPTEPGGEGNAGGEVTIGTAAEFVDVRPYPVTLATGDYAELLYEALVEPDANGEPVGVLAESVEVTDNTVYRFSLRSGVVFHDGTALDADVVLWNLERVLEEDVLFPGKPQLEEATVSAVDAMTVEIAFPSPTPQAIDFMQWVRLVSPDADLDGGVGTGPFMVGDFAPGDSVQLVRNDDYWGPSPLLDAVNIQVFPDDAALVVALEEGSVDATRFPIPTSEVRRLADVDGLAIVQIPYPGQTHLAVNPTRGCLQDVRVRQALSLAFDRQRYLDTILEGFGTVQTQPIAPSSPFYSEAVNSAVSFDLDAAADLIEEADCDVEIELMGSPRDIVSFFPVFAEDLATIGVTATITVEEQPTFVERLNGGDFDVTAFNYGGGDQDPAVLFSDVNIGPENRSLYRNPEYDAMIEAARVETDPDVRQTMYEELAAFVQQEAFSIAIVNPSLNYVISSRLQGIEFPRNAAMRLTQAYVTG